jgi:hypothetical protein
VKAGTSDARFGSEADSLHSATLCLVYPLPSEVDVIDLMQENSARQSFGASQLYTRPKITAAVQANTIFQITPSISCPAEPIGLVE